jgi:hypothetical protein
MAQNRADLPGFRRPDNGVGQARRVRRLIAAVQAAFGFGDSHLLGANNCP